MAQPNTPIAQSDKPELLWGWPIKKWVKLVGIICIVCAILFLGLPFFLALVIPLFVEDPTKFVYLVDTLDGVALILGLMGTVASVVSIIMTLADQKRFKHEKEQTSLLVKSVNELHNEVSIVEKYVRETFENHRELALQLYNANIIPNQPIKSSFGVSTDINNSEWANLCEAKESPLSEEKQHTKENSRKEEGE